MARLATDPAFRKFLTDEAELVAQTLKTADGRLLYQAQGKAQFIDMLLELMDKSRSAY